MLFVGLVLFSGIICLLLCVQQSRMQHLTFTWFYSLWLVMDGFGIGMSSVVSVAEFGT